MQGNPGNVVDEAVGSGSGAPCFGAEPSGQWLQVRRRQRPAR